MNRYELSIRYNHVVPEDADDKEPVRFIIGHEGKKGIYDTEESRCIAQTVYDHIKPTWGRYIVQMNGKFGTLMRSSGEVIVPCIYDELTEYWDKCHTVHVVALNDKFGMVSRDNNTIVPIAYDRTNRNPFNPIKKDDDHFPILVEVAKDGKLGVYSIPEKTLVVPVQFDEILPNTQSPEMSFDVRLGSKIGTFDIKSQTTIWLE